ncbi:MAG: hypothetical protein IKM97_02685 [Clostridia bacterium]|nr:hypothetical protein [Clostridia bacterium]
MSIMLNNEWVNFPHNFKWKNVINTEEMSTMETSHAVGKQVNQGSARGSNPYYEQLELDSM